MAHEPPDPLTPFISDLYSIELQALAQLEKAPDMAGDPGLAECFRTHYSETEGQAERLRGRLEELGGSPSAIKDAVMKLGGKGFLLFAKLQPETPGRLVAHAYSYEAMEWAGYTILIEMADQVGDPATADVARSIQVEERTMMERLEGGFDAAEEASHAKIAADELPADIRKHLGEAHALECQGEELLKKGVDIGGDPTLVRTYEQQLEQTRKRMAKLEARLEELGDDTSTVKDGAMKLGGLNWTAFFAAQEDTPTKLAAFVYAVEHLKIAGYELLLRSARRGGDSGTVALCQEILEGEKAAADQIAGVFPAAVRDVLSDAPA